MNCNEQALRNALAADTDVDAALTEHLSQCVQCQNRMDELAANNDQWQLAAAALSDANSLGNASIIIALDTELDEEFPLQADPISLDFLDPPSHPEMLGRIGRYEVERLIGAGGMGIVLKAFDTELHRPVAIKVLAPHLAHHGGARQRFAREAQSAASVVHEHVIPIFDVQVSAKLPYLVMQYVAGESLQARIDRLGPLSTEETLRIGNQIALGLAAAHSHGLVHRDVKPANILLETNVDRVLISDFGLARAADDASLTRSGMITGTPHYMSPEQANGQTISPVNDLFSLGSVLYFMCTGHPPFRARGTMAVLNRICQHPHRPVDQVNPQVPADLAELIDNLLEKSAEHRTASAECVANTLSQLQQDFRTGRRRTNRATRRKRRATAYSTIATIVALLTVGAIGNGWFGERKRNHSLALSSNDVTSSASIDSPKPDEIKLHPTDFVSFADPDFESAVRSVEVDLTTLEQWNRSSNSATAIESNQWQNELGELRATVDTISGNRVLPQE